MKASELINRLQEYIDFYGDLEVTCKETLTPTTTDKLEILEGKAFETTADMVIYTEYTEALPEPHLRITP